MSPNRGGRGTTRLAPRQGASQRNAFTSSMSAPTSWCGSRRCVSDGKFVEPWVRRRPASSGRCRCQPGASGAVACAFQQRPVDEDRRVVAHVLLTRRLAAFGPGEIRHRGGRCTWLRCRPGRAGCAASGQRSGPAPAGDLHRLIEAADIAVDAGVLRDVALDVRQELPLRANSSPSANRIGVIRRSDS